MADDVNPYEDDDATPFPITKPVSLVQLTAEISTALSSQVGLTLLGPGDTTIDMSPTNAATLYVHPVLDDADVAAVQGVIDAHVPNPQWGGSPVQNAFTTVYAALQNDPSYAMSDDETRALLVGLAFKVMSS